MEFDTGGDIKDLSSKNFDNDEVFAGDDVLFPNGYDEVVNHLAKDLTIEKEVVVQSIDYAGSEVLVKTNKGEKKAKFVVCTLPLGVLKAGGVAFSPVLPAAITNAIRNIWVGNVNKVALLWDTAFWDENVQYVGYCSAEKGAYNYIMNVKKFLPNVNMLMTFGFGNYGKVIEKQTDTQVKDDVMIALRKIYGNSIPEPKKVLVSRWGKDEFALGSYSFFGVDMEDADFQAFEKPLENKLFFAGEHTNVEYRGTVHGAYLSGVRAADAI
jgi:monoamine oxidase